MAVEQLIAKGDASAKESDFLSAISAYTAALKENPQAFQAYIKRSTAYSKCQNHDAAKKDISEAFQIAENRGRRDDKALCHFKLGLINYKEKDYKPALKNFEKAKELGCSEPTLELWKNKLDYEVKKNPALLQKDEIDEFDIQQENKSTNEPEDKAKSTSIDVVNKVAPLKIKIRDDWYQTNNAVIITIYAKGVKEESLSIQFSERSVGIAFPTAAGSEYNYNLDPLYSKIDSDKSSYRIYGTKLEINLVKSNSIKWPSLEGSGEEEENFVPTVTSTSDTNPALTYPSSSKKAVNWDKFNLNDEEEDKGEDFFAKLYKDVDDDTRRAMMKSYVESNGTVLTTNWSEAKDKKFETSPPEGMTARKWDQKPLK